MNPFTRRPFREIASPNGPHHGLRATPSTTFGEKLQGLVPQRPSEGADGGSDPTEENRDRHREPNRVRRTATRGRRRARCDRGRDARRRTRCRCGSARARYGRSGSAPTDNLGRARRRTAQPSAAVAGLCAGRRGGGGREHVLARTSSGQVYAWGDDSKGAVGDGGAATDRTSPVLGARPGRARDRHRRTTTPSRSSPNGTVQSWGYNNYGQLGNGTLTESQRRPGAVTGLSGVSQRHRRPRHELCAPDHRGRAGVGQQRQRRARRRDHRPGGRPR